MRVICWLVFIIGLRLMAEAVTLLEEGKLHSSMGALAFIIAIPVGFMLIAYAFAEIRERWRWLR